MSQPKTQECSVLFGPNKIIFKYESTTGQVEEPFEKDGLRIQIHVSKIFHKMLNFISAEKDLFQKEDFTLLGEMLGKIIFGGTNAQFFLQTFILRVNEPDCTRLYFDFSNNPELADLPWEYIYVPMVSAAAVKTDDQNIYLAANKANTIQLIRRMGWQETMEPESQKLNLVFVVSYGKNKEKGILERDYTPLLNVFNDLKTNYPETFDYRVIENPTLTDFKTKLTEALYDFQPMDNGDFPPYVVHYFGHARLKNGEGQVVMKTAIDGMDWVTDEKFAALFDKDFLSVKADKNDGKKLISPKPPQAVFLQACDSGKIANLKDGKGVAVALCRRNIPAVIGMQNEIDVQSSSRFSYQFYESILLGKDVAAAVTKGRYFLGHENDIQNEKDIFGNNSFGSPVLFITTKEPVTLVKKPSDQEIIEVVVQMKKCPRCGQVNEMSAESCVSCKTSFIRAKAEPARASMPSDAGASMPTDAGAAMQPKTTEAHEHH